MRLLLTQRHCIVVAWRPILELQFKLIMEPTKPCGTGQKYLTQANTLQSARGMNIDQTLEDTYLLPQDANLRQRRYGAEDSGLAEHSAAAKTESIPEARGNLITSLVPLQIHYNSCQSPWAPTLQECEVIIQQLYNANSLQSQEITHLKAVLKDLVINKKITPDRLWSKCNHLVDEKRVEEPERLPKLPFCTLPKGRPVCQANIPERVILPALKLSLSTSYADRQRRTRAVQRRRF
ncbi:uncharacterized protein si:ch211-222n4.2 isoform X2 [Electrophorus electricus]|uniref:uncharacterized protein si:ch211-222n4.2 isoform X2 n=1 Tax=Electrophorus electricus TaxID=8005 RepID=UPI0015CFB4E5|nr:uncharacterized protein si:ch211-222n4.2 isoform X2 [Electrophorus electricus]